MIRTLLACFLALLIHNTVQARELVYVGVYPFAPFAYSASQHMELRKFTPNSRGLQRHTSKGVSYDLINLLNNHQDQYRFQVYDTTPTARFKAFAHHKFDMLLFENRQWGWQQLPVLASKVYLEGGEVYIALKQEGRGQDFFDQLHDKTLIGIEGYHYGFANMNSDRDYLKQHFEIRLTHSNESSIKMLLGGRGDIAIVTQSYLKMFLSDNPAQADKLLISEKQDQHYHHTVLIRDGHSLTPATINAWLAQLQDNGSLPELWQKWGLDTDYRSAASGQQ